MSDNHSVMKPTIEHEIVLMIDILQYRYLVSLCDIYLAYDPQDENQVPNLLCEE